MTHEPTIHDDATEGKPPSQNRIAHKPQGLQGKIRIVNMHQAAGGNLRAFVDVGLGVSLVIKGFRVIQQPGQKVWVSPPQREYTGDDGNRRYAPMVELTGDLKRAVEQAILTAWEGGPQ